MIDIAKKLKVKLENLNAIKKIDIYTSHHTHFVIGTGANDPQKIDPNASRETLDHSIMYIFAVALEDGDWHHIKSYTKKDQIEKAPSNYGIQLELMRTKNGQKNIMIQIQKINHLVLEL